MAKYLAQKGYTVHVLSAQNPFAETSLWTADVKHERIHVYPLPPCYPDVLLKKEFSLWDKLSYRYWIAVLRRRYTGSIYDRAVAWQQVMSEKAAALIRKHNIVNVLATGAPFRALYYATELKKEFPSLNVLVDFRDPWTAGKSYGFEGMSAKDKAAELALEEQVVTAADTVMAPAPEILDDLRARYGHAEKYLHLQHAFDPDDFSESETTPLFSADTISFAFTGTIYTGLESTLNELVSMLQQLRQQQPAVYRKVRIDFYTTDQQHSELFAPVADAVRILKPLPPRQLYAALRQYRFALVLFTEQYKEFLSTKFWELFYLRLPVVYMGPEGKVSEFLRAHDLGIALTGTRTAEELKELMIKGMPGTFRFDVDTSSCSYATIVSELENHLR